MSTKIYNAYRTRKNGVNLFSLVSLLRARVEKNIRRVLAEEMRQIGGTPYVAYDKLLQAFKKQHPLPYKDHYGMDVSITFRELGSRYYIIAYANGMMSNVWKFLARHPWLEDFHYQNSTDKSAKCSDAAWEARHQIWKELGYNHVLSTSRWWDVVTVDVLNPDSLFRIIHPLIYTKRGNARGR